MLFSYQQQCQRFIRDARQDLVNPDDLVTFINEARGQLAGEAKCLLALGTLAITGASQVYPFTSIAALGAGVAAPLNVRTLWLNTGTGRARITPRPWPWFSLYNLTTPAIAAGAPTVWTQYAQGAGGTLYVSPIPNAAYTLSADCTCYPAPLATDADVEAIPYLWTDAVPYYAAYLALLSMETPAALQEADKMYSRYQEYAARARLASTPDIMPNIYQQAQPMPSNALGSPPRGGQ